MRCAGVAGWLAVLGAVVACGSADPPVRAWSCAGSLVCGASKGALPSVVTCEARELSAGDVSRRLADVCAAAAQSSCPGAVCLLLCERAPERDAACARDGG